MSQMTPAVNLINPVQGSEGNVSTIAGNQVAKAEIAARLKMQRAQLEAEAELAKAQLADNERSRQAQLEGYRNLNESRERMQTQELEARAAEQEKNRRFELEQWNRLVEREEQKRREADELSIAMADAEIAAMEGRVQGLEQTEARLREFIERRSKLVQQSTAEQLLLKAQEAQSQADLSRVREDLARQQAVYGGMKQQAMQAGQAAVERVVAEAVENYPTFWQRSVTFSGPVTAIVSDLLSNAREALAPGSQPLGGEVGRRGGMMSEAGKLNPMFNATVFAGEFTRAALQELGSEASWEQVAPMVAALVTFSQHRDLERVDAEIRRAAEAVGPAVLEGIMGAIAEHASSGLARLTSVGMGDGGEKVTLNKQERDARARTADSIRSAGRLFQTRFAALDMGDQSEDMLRGMDQLVAAYATAGNFDQIMEIAPKLGINTRAEVIEALKRVLAATRGREKAEIAERIRQLEQEITDIDIRSDLLRREDELTSMRGGLAAGKAKVEARRDVLRRRQQQGQ